MNNNKKELGQKEGGSDCNQSGDLSSMPRTHLVTGENQLLYMSLYAPIPTQG